jgi:hypothetical protein
MNNKLLTRFLIVTFAFSFLLWGAVILLTRVAGFSIDHPIPYALTLLGSFGPSVGAYCACRKAGRFSGIKDFLKFTFSPKASLVAYLLIPLSLLLYYLYPLLSGKIVAGEPYYVALLALPIMLFGGGMEEPGWRGLLFPKLFEKHSFLMSTFAVAVVWAIWHTPLFLIEGSSQSGANPFAFLLLIVGMSFCQATLAEHSRSVFLSVLLHCAFNAAQISLVVDESISNACFMAGTMAVGSLLARFVLMKLRRTAKPLS